MFQYVTYTNYKYFVEKYLKHFLLSFNVVPPPSVYIACYSYDGCCHLFKHMLKLYINDHPSVYGITTKILTISENSML